MSDRVVAYYRQEVTHGEVDQWHDQLEAADQAIVAENGMWGIVDGLVVSESAIPDFKVRVSVGVAYDENGQRIVQTGGPTDYDLVTYIPVIAGQDRHVAIYYEDDTTDSDARVDGNGVPLNYLKEESFNFHLELGTVGVAPQPKPAIVPNKVLLAVVHLTQGMASIVNADISMDWYGLPAASVDRHVGGVVAPGRLLDGDKRIAFDGTIGDTVITVGSTNTLDTDGGDITVGGGLTDTEGGDIDMGGGDIDCETGDVLNATQVKAEEPDPVTGEGFLYANPSSGTLREVDKYLAYDASGFLPGNKPGGTGSHPWDLTPVGNSWYLSETAKAGLTTAGDLRWRMDFGLGGAGESCGLYLPIHPPYRSKLITAKGLYSVDGAGMGANHYLRMYLMRKIMATGAIIVDILNSGGVSDERTAAAGGYEWSETFTTSGTQEFAQQDTYCYYIVIVHYASGVLVAEDVVSINSVRIHYKIREASGVHTV